MNPGVVITGMGLVSCLGQGLEQVRQALREGRSGVVRDPMRRELGFRSDLTGALPDFEPAALLDRKARRGMGEPALYAAVAALRAMEHAGLGRQDLSGPDCGVILGNDSAAGATMETVDETRRQGGTTGLGATAVVKAMTSSPTINLAALLGTQGAAWTVAGACASGAHAIGQAWSLIATGQQGWKKARCAPRSGSPSA